MQMQEARAVGRIEPQPCDAWQARRQREPHDLPLDTDHAGGSDLVFLGHADCVAEIELGREQRSGRLAIGVLGGCASFARSLAGRCDQLVGAGVGLAQQIARDGRRQPVERHLEFRLGQRPLDCLDRIDRPALCGQQFRQRTAGEKAQMRAIEQALFAILEVTLHQFGHQPAVGGVWHRNQQLPARRQQLTAGQQRGFGLPQVLQHVAADHAVIRLAAEHRGPLGLVEVGDFYPPVVRPCERGFVLVDGDTIDNAARMLAQVLAQRAAAGAKVEYACAGRHHAGQHRERSPFALRDRTQIHVAVGDGVGHCVLYCCATHWR